MCVLLCKQTKETVKDNHPNIIKRYCIVVKQVNSLSLFFVLHIRSIGPDFKYFKGKKHLTISNLL